MTIPLISTTYYNQTILNCGWTCDTALSRVNSKLNSANTATLNAVVQSFCCSSCSRNLCNAFESKLGDNCTSFEDSSKSNANGVYENYWIIVLGLLIFS